MRYVVLFRVVFILFLAMPVACFLYSCMCARCMCVLNMIIMMVFFLSTIYDDGHLNIQFLCHRYYYHFIRLIYSYKQSKIWSWKIPQCCYSPGNIDVFILHKYQELAHPSAYFMLMTVYNRCLPLCSDYFVHCKYQLIQYIRLYTKHG